VSTRFSLSAEAASDIREIWLFIANDSVRAARKVRLQIMDACERLAQNPGIGHVREDLTERPLKSWRSDHTLLCTTLGSDPKR
jgi:antitoxin ParD1/3/4/toxin ParE1/3/4